MFVDKIFVKLKFVIAKSMYPIRRIFRLIQINNLNISIFTNNYLIINNNYIIKRVLIRLTTI